MSALSLLLTCGLLGVAAATAEGDDEAAREADMFGSPDEVPTSTASAAAPAPVVERRPMAGLAARAAEESDHLTIGGQVWLRLDYATLEKGDPESFSLRSPNFLDVYLDARPTDRLRGYVQGRLRFEPTTAGKVSPVGYASFGQSGGEAEDALTFGAPRPDTVGVSLDQLWVTFDIDRTVFVTAGRQRIKWGTGRVWNPTDFLNQERKDPLAIFDERLGVTLLKVHVPIESLGWNFYAFGTFDEAERPEDVGGALRAEFLFGETEIALSGAVRKDRPIRLGADLSSALGPFDVRVEAAFLQRVKDLYYRGEFNPAELKLPEEYERKGEVLVQVVAGAEISIKYSDEDNVALGAEYFYNSAGYDSAEYYPLLLAVSRFTPFYLGKHYAAAYALLAGPGQWDNTSFVLTGIGNLSDRSFVARLDYQVRVLTYLDLNAYGSVHFGSADGELHLGIDFPAVPFVPALAHGYQQPAPLFDLGVGIRVEL